MVKELTIVGFVLNEHQLCLNSVTQKDSSPHYEHTVASDDAFTQSACSLLGLSTTAEAPFITFESLHTALRQLTQRLTTAQGLLRTMFQKQEDMMNEQYVLSY